MEEKRVYEKKVFFWMENSLPNFIIFCISILIKLYVGRFQVFFTISIEF